MLKLPCSCKADSEIVDSMRLYPEQTAFPLELQAELLEGSKSCCSSTCSCRSDYVMEKAYASHRYIGMH